ncbi:GWxTD domain-containing protein [Acidobacteriota bacterium]
MKKTGLLIKLASLLIVNLIFINCTSQVTSKVKLDPNSQKFLDYVSYIILPVEEKIFREMPPEDRGQFLEDFWGRRDPDPSTKVNEYRQDFYARLAYANKAFHAGKPGWKTERGRIYILLGPPTNIIDKPMGDAAPSERGYYQQDAGTSNTPTVGISEKANEIWIYNQYTEFTGGPLQLLFIDYQGSGDYKLTTTLDIEPFALSSSIREEPDLTKYQIIGEAEKEEYGFEAIGIFDYDVILETDIKKNSASVLLSISIPYFRLGYRKEKDTYSCDLDISAEALGSQNLSGSKKNEVFSKMFSDKELKNLVKDRVVAQMKWELNISPGVNKVYVSITDNTNGKILRKLFQAEGD